MEKLKQEFLNGELKDSSMIISDKEALHQLKLADSNELYDLLESFEEVERDGRSDIQILADEVSWLLYKYSTKEFRQGCELYETKRILKATNNGMIIPLDIRTLTPVYKVREVTEAKSIVAEYNRLRNLRKRLSDKGIYGMY